MRRHEIPDDQRDRNNAYRFINLMKQCRRVATRSEKTASNYFEFVHASAILVLMH